MSISRAGVVVTQPVGPRLADRFAELRVLTDRLIERAAPVAFAVVRSEAEREAVFRLRHRAVVARRWAVADDLPEGIERDGWDTDAVHVGGWDGSTLVACARLVFPAAGHPLPVETVFDLTVEPAGSVVHVDRLVVARSHSEADHRVFAGLMARTWHEAYGRGFHVCAGIDSRPMLRLYRRLGLDLTVLGPSRTYWNEERSPVRCDLADAVTGLARHWLDADAVTPGAQ